MHSFAVNHCTMIKKSLCFLRKLLVFQKPAIAELHCLSLVMAHKPVAIVSWELTNGHCLRLYPLRRRFRGATGAAIVRIPTGCTTLKVVAANYWRRTHTTITLMFLAPDAATEALLRTRLSEVFLAGITCPAPPAGIAAAPPRLHPGTPPMSSFKNTLLHIPHPQLLPFTTPNIIYET